MLTLISLLSVLLGVVARDDCYGAPVVIQQEALTYRGQYWYGIQAYIGKRLPMERGTPKSVVLADPLDACLELLGTPSYYQGKIVLASRGNCTYLSKAINAQAAEASLLLVYNSKAGCPLISGNLSDPALKKLEVPIVGISTLAGQHFKAVAQSGQHLSCWAPQQHRLDPAAGLIWLISVLTVAAAAVWAGKDLQAGRQRLQDGSTIHSAGGPRETAVVADSLEVQKVTSAGAVAFVIIASIMLLFLYFLLNRVFAIILVFFFCFASIQAMVILIGAGFKYVAPGFSSQSFKLTSATSIPYHALAACLPAAACLALWFNTDINTVGWLFQDLMGIALIILILRQFLLPDLKVACLLLPLCLGYDIFWVFVQPRLTQSPSVMVEVATGGSSHEAMPMLIRVPTLLGPPYGNSILGFGDIVLPGLLVVFTRIWDCSFQKPIWLSYFLPTLAGYGIGLLITFLALFLEIGGNQGQPALLYLVPSTLGVCILLSWSRGDLLQMWRGSNSKVGPPAPTRIPSDTQDREEALEQSVEERTPLNNSAQV